MSPLFVSWRSFVLNTKGTTGSDSLQVELRHVQHAEVDGAVMSDEGNKQCVIIH